MNDFDQAARHAVKADPEGMLRWVFPRLATRFRFARWFDAQSAPRPGEPDRRCDTIAELLDQAGTGPPRAVILELFSDSDADAVDRLMEYTGRYRRELRHGPHGRDRYPFSGVLIFLRGGTETIGWEANLPDEPDVEISFRPKLFCVARESAVATLAAVEDNRLTEAVLAFVPLMKGGQTLKIVKRWRGRVEGIQDGNRKKTLVDIAHVFAELTRSRETWKKGLKGLTMNESITMREVRVETQRHSLIDVLEARFPAGIPSDLRERIERQSDFDELSRWNRLAATARDLDTFREAITT